MRLNAWWREDFAIWRTSSASSRPPGSALLGANGQGKTNLLEAIYYPVLFRSLRGAPDQEVARFGGPGFQVEARSARRTAA